MANSSRSMMAGESFDRRAAAACGGLNQPEQRSCCPCGGAGWDEPGRCRADRWHGPRPDAAGLGTPRRNGPGWETIGQLLEKATGRASRRSGWRSSPMLTEGPAEAAPGMESKPWSWVALQQLAAERFGMELQEYLCAGP